MTKKQNKMEKIKKTATKEIVKEYMDLFKGMDAYDQAKNDRITEIVNEYNLDNCMLDENGMCGLKDCLGEVLVPAEFDDIQAYENIDFASWPSMVRKNGKWGVVANDGKATVIVPLEYAAMHDVTAPFFAAMNSDGKWGLLDSEGAVVIPFEMDRIYRESSDGFVFFDKGGKMGVYQYDVEPTVLTGAIFDEIEEACAGELLTVINDGRKGWITTDGQFVACEDRDSFCNEDGDLDLITATN